MHVLRTLIFAAILAVSLGGCAGRGANPPSPTAAPASVTPQSPAAPATGAATPVIAPSGTPAPLATAAPVTPAALPTAVSTSAPVGAGALPVRLQIPKLDVPVVEMGWLVIQTQDGLRSDWDIPKDAAGHHLNSARLGEAGNLVISGHNNIYGQVFRPISLAWNNDQRVKVDDYTDQSDVLNGAVVKLFDAAGAEHDYLVSAFYRLKETGASLEQQAAHAVYMQPTDHEQVTLITCWPPTSNTHRLILIARPAQ
jgi:sortase A